MISHAGSLRGGFDFLQLVSAQVGAVSLNFCDGCGLYVMELRPHLMRFRPEPLRNRGGVDQILGQVDSRRSGVDRMCKRRPAS